MRQIIDPNMRKLIQSEMDKTLEMRYVNGKLKLFYHCNWDCELNGEKYCHFLVPEACPIGMQEDIPTEVYHIPGRSRFYRCVKPEDGI
jgi:hypothetical protein